MIRSIYIYLSILLLLTNHISLAGSVSSGGGKLIGTEYNPWFLENTATVQYCINIDPSAFKPSRTETTKAVEFAIKKWQSTFQEAMITDPFYRPGEIAPFDNIRLATQRFIEVECSEDNLDLKFQFGSLTDAQKLQIPDYKSYVGVAVRSEYDIKRLRASGFIYIAADTGQHRPSVKDFAIDPWSAADNAILKTVLIHELGHVFGLRHESGFKNVMSEALIDLYVKQHVVDAIAAKPTLIYDKLLKHLHVFNYNPNQVITECHQWSIKGLVELLRLPSDSQCIRLIFSHNQNGENKLRIRVEASYGSSMKFYQHGFIESDQGLITQARPVIEIKLPIEQEVFTKLPRDYSETPLFAGYERVYARRFKAKYTNISGNTVDHLFGEIKEEGNFRIGAFYQGEIKLDIFSY